MDSGNEKNSPSGHDEPAGNTDAAACPSDDAAGPIGDIDSKDFDSIADVIDGEITSDSGFEIHDAVKKSSEGENHPGAEDSTHPKSQPLEQLCNFTQSAVGYCDFNLPCLPVVAAKPRNAWLRDLQISGFASLLYVNISSLTGSDGFDMSRWFGNKSYLRRRLVKTPLENVASAGIFTSKKSLPKGSLINSVICTIAELIAFDKEVDYFASTVQIFVPSPGGFSQCFRIDEPDKESAHNRYRCFWYLGLDSSETTKGFSSDSEREEVFIGCAGNNLKMFGEDKVITLEGYFFEANRKFRLHPGDILIMDNKYPFSVDLPIGGRAKGARVMSWHVLPSEGGVSHPKIMPESEIVMSIESIVASNTEAKDFYDSEFESMEVHPGPIGDPEGHMQRLRVTPKKYLSQDVIDEVENNASILYVNNEYFNL